MTFLPLRSEQAHSPRTKSSPPPCSSHLTSPPPTPMPSSSSSATPMCPEIGELPVEIVSEEEMALIEASLAASASRPLLSVAARSIAPLSCAAYSAACVIEDSPPPPPPRRYLLARLRERRTLAVPDITSTTFEDVLKYFKVTCHTLSRSQEQLLLRYELQADHSLLEEYQFSYDARWFKDQIQEALSFWLGAREPKFVTEEEMWKCKFCKFASNCPKMTSTTRC